MKKLLKKDIVSSPLAIACLLQMSKEEFYAYKLRRKQENKPNYYLQSLKEIEEIKKTYTDRKPKLLLHTCCAVCAGWPLEFLSSVFDITIYYNNSYPAMLAPGAHPSTA